MNKYIKTLLFFFIIPILGGIFWIVKATTDQEYETTSADKPDLYLEDIEIDERIDWTENSDRKIIVYFTIRNIGGVKANTNHSVHTLYRTDTNAKIGELIIDKYFDYINPGQSKRYKLKTYSNSGVKDFAGEYFLRLNINSTKLVEEENYNNNTNEITLIVNPGREKSYPEGYNCTTSTCNGSCRNNICYENNYNYNNSYPNNNTIYYPNNEVSVCLASTCSGECLNSICYENKCDSTNCGGACINNLCYLNQTCNAGNCKGTCADNVCKNTCEIFAYDRCRLSLSEEKNLSYELRINLENALNTDDLNLEAEQWHTLVNAYIYGKYPLKALLRSIELNGITVHPTISWETWRNSTDYQNNI